MSFLLGGTEAIPKQGVTRSSVRDHCDYPIDRYGGFATECEWVLCLLISGTAIHVPRPLYLKRIRGPNETTASSKRVVGHSREHLFEALEHHRARMLALIQQADLPKTMRDTVELAAEAAMLRRHMTFNMGAFYPVQIARSDQIIRATRAMPGSYGKGSNLSATFIISPRADDSTSSNSEGADSSKLSSLDEIVKTAEKATIPSSNTLFKNNNYNYISSEFNQLIIKVNMVTPNLWKRGSAASAPIFLPVLNRPVKYGEILNENDIKYVFILKFASEGPVTNKRSGKFFLKKLLLQRNSWGCKDLLCSYQEK